MAESSTITREGDQPCISSRDQFPERRGDWMQTFTGRRFWPLDPRPEDVSVEDIAHALSLQCRFGGHCLRFYSVAEHSVHLARWALSHGAGSIAERLTLALWLLLHDGGEAYVSDMVRPLKRHMPEFRQIEDGVTWAIYERFGLDPAMEPREVKQLDNRILMDERAQVMRPTGDAWHFGGETEPLGVTLQFWSPEQAEAEFLATVWLLTPEGAAAEPPRCFACSEPFKDGDRVFEDVNEGTIHAACLGPERESYVGADGEPLKPGEPIPEPGVYRTAPKVRDDVKCQCVSTFGPSPECGACGGSGCVTAEVEGPKPGDLHFRSEWEASREISHEEAREIARRLIASHFRRTDTETARASIPANPDRDDDLLICSYIKQQARKEAARG